MIERMARLGYASIAAVYVIVGCLAVAAGLGRRGSGADHDDAFTLIFRQPFGGLLLAIIAIGLSGYALWRFAAGFADSDSRGSDAKGIAVRVGSVFRGLAYAVLTVAVVRVMMHRKNVAGDQAKHWAALVIDEPFGQTLIAAAGLGILGYGAYQLYRAWESKLGKRLHLEKVDASVRGKVLAVSRFGIAARGVIFLVIGGSLVAAAVRHKASAAQDASGAMQQIAVPFGGASLVLMGLGLVAYGVYAFTNARYRTIKT